MCSLGGVMKDVGMRIRVEPQLREVFVRLCREKDVPAAQVLRAFMRDFVDREGSNSQLIISYTNDESNQFKLEAKEK